MGSSAMEAMDYSKSPEQKMAISGANGPRCAEFGFNKQARFEAMN